MPGSKYHLTIKEKKEIVSYCDENLGISTRKVALNFKSKFGRPIHHSSIARVLERRNDISMTPQKGRARSKNVRVKSSKSCVILSMGV